MPILRDAGAVLKHLERARVGLGAGVVGAGAAGVDARYARVLLRGGEVCERAEDAFGHWGAADVAEADEEDGDGFVGWGGWVTAR